MDDEKKKPEDTPKETKKPGELKDEDLEKAAGGSCNNTVVQNIKQ